MALLYISLLLLVLLMPCATPLILPSNTTDLEALLAFKAEHNDPLGILASNWTSTVSFCFWIGVLCDHHRQQVTGLQFSDVPLQGSVTPQVGNLSLLSSLVLSNTSIIGPLPNELGSLHRLRTLVLIDNSFSGTIPRTLGNLSRLELLDLARNNFFGGGSTRVTQFAQLTDTQTSRQ
jgi:Leucine-rich repeat (LRR) protein